MSDTLQHPVNVIRTTPLLMCQNIRPHSLLLPLNQIHISQHPIRLKPRRQLTRNRRRTMQPRQTHQLQHKPSFCQLGTKFLEIRIRKPLCRPIERRGKVIHEPFVRVLFTDTRGKSLCLFEIGEFGFEPEHVGIGGKGEDAGDGGFDACGVLVVAFFCATDFGGPVDVLGEMVLG